MNLVVTPQLTVWVISSLSTMIYPRRENLNGVIQIFNLFYIKETDLSKALVHSETTSNTFRFADEENMTNYDIEHLVPQSTLALEIWLGIKRYSKRLNCFQCRH